MPIAILVDIINAVVESWQSGNAPDSKSGEPANTGAQVQILYSPFYKQYAIVQIILKSPINVDMITFIGDLFVSEFSYVLVCFKKVCTQFAHI